MLSVFLLVILVSISGLLLCWYLGWGLTQRFAPSIIQPFVPLAAPLIGYAMLLWFGFMAVSTLASMRVTLPLMILFASLANFSAWRSGARPLTRAQLRTGWPLLLILTLNLLSGVLPLLHYGYPTIIGQNWDPEIYLPMANYLRDYPIAQIPFTPQTPLRELVDQPPGVALTIGFSILQASLSWLTTQSAFATFAPTLAFLHTLGTLAVYLWLRATMEVERVAALLGTTLTALGSILLWAVYFNFGMQLSAWPLIPLGLTLGLATVEELARRGPKAWPTLLVGALVLAALPVAYYPALTLWGPLAAALGGARLLAAIRPAPAAPTFGRIIGAGTALLLLVLLLSMLTYQDYFEGFAFYYSQLGSFPWVDRFVSLPEIIGIAPFRLVAPDPTLNPLHWGALILSGGLLLATLLVAPKARNPLGDPRLRWLMLLAGGSAYLLWLRFSQAFPYGYLKGSAYAGFIFCGALAAGLPLLSNRLAPQRRTLAQALVALLLIGTAANTQASLIATYWKGPATFTQPIADFDQATNLIPANASVLISSHEAFTGPTSGILSAMLYGRTLWGRYLAGYTHLNTWPTGGFPNYIVLAANERAWPLDLGGRELWRSSAIALYQLDGSRYLLSGRPAMTTPILPENRKSPAEIAIWRRAGANQIITPTNPITISAGFGLAFGPTDNARLGKLSDLSFTLAALTDCALRIDGLANGHPFSETFTLAAGVSQISMRLPTPLNATLYSNQPMAVIQVVHTPTATLTEKDNPPPVERSFDSKPIVWNLTTTQQGATIALDMQLTNPDRHALRAELVVVDDSFTTARRLTDLLGVLPISGTWHLAFNPQSGASEARVNGIPTPLLSANTSPNPPDGDYFGALMLYAGSETVSYTPIFRMRIDHGAIAAFTPVPLTIEATAIGWGRTLPGNQRDLLPTTTLQVDEDRALLERAIAHTPRAGRTLTPGEQLTLELEWLAQNPHTQLMVSAQIIGPDNRKLAQWDGPLGGDWHPNPSWHAGERIRQDLPLTLAATSPPGTYQLLLIVYDPTTNTPSLLNGQRQVVLGTLEVQAAP